MKKIFLLSWLTPFIIFGFTGCGDDDNNSNAVLPVVDNAQPPVVVPAAQKKVLLAEGQTEMQADVSRVRVYYIGQPATMDAKEIYANHPILSQDQEVLNSITKVRLTSLQTIELYSEDKIVVVLAEPKNSPWVVYDSLDGFKPDEIVYIAPTFNEEPTVSVPVDGMLSFSYHGCTKDVGSRCPIAYVDLYLKQTGINIGDEIDHTVTDNGNPVGP
jgi:hypothetical protein